VPLGVSDEFRNRLLKATLTERYPGLREDSAPCTRRLGIRWNLRKLMADRGMFHTTDLVPELAERGIHLSREQVFRLVTQTRQRLSTDALAALCDILQCTPNDLIEVEVVNAEVRKAVGETDPDQRPRRAA
jgi:DNA-binding Xre family transcriptional regulator